MRRKRRLLSLILAVGLTFNSVGMYAEDMTENQADVDLLLEESNDGLEQEIVLEKESEGSSETVISLDELSGEVDDFLVKVSTLDGSSFSDGSSLDLVGLKELVKNDKSYDNVDSYKEYFKNFIVSELLKEDGEELSRSYESYSERVIDVHPLLLCVNEEVQREKYKVNLGFTDEEFVKSLKDKEIRVYDFKEKDEKLVSNLLKSELVENNLEFELENQFIVVVELDKNWVKETVEDPVEEPVEESEVVVKGNEEDNEQVVDVINTVEEDGVFIEETQSNDEEKKAEVELGTEKGESVFDEVHETVLETESEIETETEETTEALVNGSTEVETEEVAETETELENVSKVETESLMAVETEEETESEIGVETESETEPETENVSEVETETEELSETEPETEKSTEEESENKDEEYLQVPEIYVYEDDEILVKAYLKSTKFIGDDVTLSVEKINLFK